MTIDVDASWETWESTNVDDEKLEFCDVFSGVPLDRIAVGPPRKGGTSVLLKAVHGTCATHGTSTVRNTMARPRQRSHIQT